MSRPGQDLKLAVAEEDFFFVHFSCCIETIFIYDIKSKYIFGIFQGSSLKVSTISFEYVDSKVIIKKSRGEVIFFFNFLRFFFLTSFYATF